jgi:hypothetical protein
MQIFFKALVIPAFIQKVPANRTILNFRVTAFDSHREHKISGFPVGVPLPLTWRRELVLQCREKLFFIIFLFFIPCF